MPLLLPDRPAAAAPCPDQSQLGIREAFKVKHAALLSATEAAEMILRVRAGGAGGLALLPCRRRGRRRGERCVRRVPRPPCGLCVSVSSPPSHICISPSATALSFSSTGGRHHQGGAAAARGRHVSSSLPSITQNPSSPARCAQRPRRQAAGGSKRRQRWQGRSRIHRERASERQLLPALPFPALLRAGHCNRCQSSSAEEARRLQSLGRPPRLLCPAGGWPLLFVFALLSLLTDTPPEQP